MDAVREAAEHELRLVLRRVKREMAKAGVALRYVAITSDMDGDTGETVRVHHHLVVPAEAKEAFTEKWAGMGGVDWSPMSDQEDYTPIAGLPDPTGAESTGREKVCEQPEPGAPAAERPRGPDRGGTARAERGETASPKRVQTGPAPVHPVCAARRTSSTGRRLAKKTHRAAVPPCKRGKGVGVVHLRACVPLFSCPVEKLTVRDARFAVR